VMYRYNLIPKTPLSMSMKPEDSSSRNKPRKKNGQLAHRRLRLGVTERLALIVPTSMILSTIKRMLIRLDLFMKANAGTLETLFSLEEGDIGFGLRFRMHGIGEFGF